MYNFVLIFAAQQSDSIIHVDILSHVLFHYGSSQDTEHSSLCSAVGLLFFLYTVVCIC